MRAADPQETALIRGESLAVTTIAPAPSAVRMQVLRSVQSVTADSFSEAMTSAAVAVPVRMALSAIASA